MNGKCVARLKATIPLSLRHWDKDDKGWVVSGPGIAQAVAHARAFYDRVEDIPATPPPPLRTVAAASPHAVFFLTDDAPAALVPIMFRTLAKMHHPDRGGDRRTRQAIDRAYETICKAVQR